MDLLELGKPLHILLVSTGITTRTDLAVSGVKDRLEKNPEKYNTIFSKAEELVLQAREALAAGNLELIGQLMNQNHELLNFCL